MIDDNVLFRFESIQDYRDASQVIANTDQGGLGLPDRDYYTKTDAKSVELRKGLRSARAENVRTARR
jgi:putative endopeptidase